MAENKKKKGELLSRFLPYYKKYKWILVLDLFCAALTTVCELVLPMIVSEITHRGETDPSSLTWKFVLTMGGIYLLGPQKGTVVAENRIHDVSCAQYGAWGIYLDEGSSFVTLEKNVVFRAMSNCLHLHYGSQNVVRNNLFFGGSSPCIRIGQEELHQQILFEQNILVTDGAPFYSYRGDHSIAARRNLLWDLQSKTPVAFRHKHGEEISLADWQTLYGHDRGSILADPMLKDPANGDFTLSERSPAYDLGFSPLTDAVAKR